jgi:hypothetical protein
MAWLDSTKPLKSTIYETNGIFADHKEFANDKYLNKQVYTFCPQLLDGEAQSGQTPAMTQP